MHKKEKITISSVSLSLNETQIQRHLPFNLSDNRFSHLFSSNCFNFLIQFGWESPGSPHFCFLFFFSSFALWAERKDWNCANPALLQIPKMKSKQMMAAKKTVRRDSWLPWNYRELQKILCQHGFSNDQGLLWEVLLWKQVNTKFVWKIWSSDDHWHAGQTQFLMTLCSLYEYN